MNLIYPDNVIEALEQNVIFANENLKPMLGIISSKNASPDERSYLKSIINHANKYNVDYKIFHVNSEHEVAEAIYEIKTNKEEIFNGVICLCTFKNQEISRALFDMIPPRIDLDCMSSSTLGLFLTDKSEIAYRTGPCAPAAAMKILEYNDIDLAGKNVAVLGRSLRVGRPLAEMLCKKDATVTVFHSKSSLDCLYEYEIIISAIGKPKCIDASMLQWDDEDKLENTWLIDIGINVDPDTGKLCGDFDLDSFKDTDVNITPVPGCVGKLTTTILFAKLFSSARQMKGSVKNDSLF